MEKFKSLNRCQKGILLFLIAMALVFTMVYSITISKVGFRYKDTIFTQSMENGSTVYSGKIQGQQARFTVSEDKTVVFQHGNKTYGPYTAKEDPTAIPKDGELADAMTGVEIRQGEDVLFRGGIFQSEDSYWLFNEDGALENVEISYAGRDEIDPAPSAATILELINDPELTHKGEWLALFGALSLCVLNAISILFADEMFRWDLSFRIRNADHAEPSDWEMITRYISWTLLSIGALVLFIMGLK